MSIKKIIKSWKLTYFCHIQGKKEPPANQAPELPFCSTTNLLVSHTFVFLSFCLLEPRSWFTCLAVRLPRVCPTSLFLVFMLPEYWCTLHRFGEWCGGYFKCFQWCCDTAAGLSSVAEKHKFHHFIRYLFVMSNSTNTQQRCRLIWLFRTESENFERNVRSSYRYFRKCDHVRMIQDVDHVKQDADLLNLWKVKSKLINTPKTFLEMRLSSRCQADLVYFIIHYSWICGRETKEINHSCVFVDSPFV